MFRAFERRGAWGPKNGKKEGDSTEGGRKADKEASGCCRKATTEGSETGLNDGSR